MGLKLRACYFVVLAGGFLVALVAGNGSLVAQTRVSHDDFEQVFDSRMPEDKTGAKEMHEDLLSVS